jgi:hypothetical protein
MSLKVCDWHVMCEACTGPCKETDFEIEPSEAAKQDLLPVSITKYFSGFGKECYSAADEYMFEVPDDWKMEDWLKFIASIQFFDMLFFEQSFQFWCICSCNSAHS